MACTLNLDLAQLAFPELLEWHGRAGQWRALIDREFDTLVANIRLDEFFLDLTFAGSITRETMRQFLETTLTIAESSFSFYEIAPGSTGKLTLTFKRQ